MTDDQKAIEALRRFGWLRADADGVERMHHNRPKLFQCQTCGTGVDLIFAPSPDASDGDETLVWLCGMCRRERGQDV
jgi:hypothetical protein